MENLWETYSTSIHTQKRKWCTFLVQDVRRPYRRNGMINCQKWDDFSFLINHLSQCFSTCGLWANFSTYLSHHCKSRKKNRVQSSWIGQALRGEKASYFALNGWEIVAIMALVPWGHDQNATLTSLFPFSPPPPWSEAFWRLESPHVVSLMLRRPSEASKRPKNIASVFCPKPKVTLAFPKARMATGSFPYLWKA